MANCRRCAYAVFDTIWGEWKCKKLTRRVVPEKETSCTKFEKKSLKKRKETN